MRESERVEKILMLIKEIWRKNPDMRFNQLIDNLHHEFLSINPIYLNGDKIDLFYLEDDIFEKFLKDFLVKIEQTFKDN